ncbi:hypothetical protein [Streptomyces sp. NPDC127197]|uniref:hypothetical protein n=1 Tax=Streptomyces sp. NPDC127197 TaxID=3345388 RepID=UPI003645F63B
MSTDDARRPGSVTLAVILLILGTFVAAVAASSDPGVQNLTAGLVLACFWFGIRAGRGRRTARTTVTCLTVVMLVFATPFALADPLYGGVTLLLAAALAVPGVALLYTPRAEAYVRARMDLLHADRALSDD